MKLNFLYQVTAASRTPDKGLPPRSPFSLIFCPQLNLLNPPPSPEQNSWIRHCMTRADHAYFFWCQTFEFDLAYAWKVRINNMPCYVCLHDQLPAYRFEYLKRSLWSRTNRGQSDTPSRDLRTTFAQRFRATQNTEAFTSILMRNPHTPPPPPPPRSLLFSFFLCRPSLVVLL